MKHLVIIGLLLAASVVGYLALNKGGAADAIHTAISKVTPERTPPIDKHGAEVSAKAALPLAEQSVATIATNNSLTTNSLAPSVATNSWERTTAGKYADLIQEIRSARANGQ